MNKLEILTESLQKECHAFTDALIKADSRASYQDATNIWLFMELAKMQLRISSLEINKITNE